MKSKWLNANLFQLPYYKQEYVFARVQILKAYKEKLFIKHLKNNIRHLETRTGVSYVFCFKFTPLMNTYFLTICRNAYRFRFQIFIIMHYLQNITRSTFTEITRNTKRKRLNNT